MSLILFLSIHPAFAQYPQTPDGKQRISIPQGMIPAKEELVTKVQEISVEELETSQAGEEIVEEETEEEIKEGPAPEAAQPPAPQEPETKKLRWKERRTHTSIGNDIVDVFGSFFREFSSMAIMGSPDRNTKKTLRKGRGGYDLQKELGIINVAGMPSAAPRRLSLDDCIEIALHNHIPLQTAKKSMRLAEMRIAEAKRNMLPTVTLQYDQYTGEIYGRKYFGRKQFLEGQQPIWHGGELYYSLKQAETNLEVTRNDYQKTKNEVVLQIKKAYYTLAKAKGNLVMQQDLSRETERVHDMVKKQLEADIISKLEFLNVSSQAGQVKYQLVSAEGDVAVAELILKQAMNMEPSDIVDIEPEIGFKKVDIDFSRALAAAYITRPEMRINLLMIDYHTYGRRVARARQYPKVDLLGMWGLSKELYISKDNGLTANNTQDPAWKLAQQWYGGVKASVPFGGNTAEYSWTREQWTPAVSAYQGTEANTQSFRFKFLDKLDTYSERQLAEIDYDKARQELVKIRQDVTLEIREGCFNYEKAVVQFETARNKVKFQERDLEFVKLRRSMGEADDSNVVESMIKLAQEKFGYLQSLADCHIALATINKSIGQEDYFKDEPPDKAE